MFFYKLVEAFIDCQIILLIFEYISIFPENMNVSKIQQNKYVSYII